MSDSEDDYNRNAHNSLLQAISGLKKTQHIRKTTRNEPKITQNEFELVKGTSVTTNEAADDGQVTSAVGVNDLVQVLHKKKKHLDAGKLLRNVQRSRKVYQKPLEKPAAERIKRQIGYDKVKTKLKRWDAVVSQHRAAETQVFPLASESIYINTSLHAGPMQHSIKSDLRREMEAAEEKLRQLKRQREGDVEDEQLLENRREELYKMKLTREELVARRKELAYLKIRESQQSAKARLRNKIKSKKYHKLLRRQKLQEQLKEFEQLQKTDPEAALEKLNELEKSRVRERATLRHKNTGTWAKNLQVRAKYDKDVRKDLSEQLQLSRDLTQKSKTNQESDEENIATDGEGMQADMDENDDQSVDPMNPWITASKKGNAAKKAAKEHDENWRKYWLERNQNDKLMNEYKRDLEEAKMQQEAIDTSSEIVAEETEIAEVKRKEKKRIKTGKKCISKTKCTKKSPVIENGWSVEEIEEVPDRSTIETLPEIDDIFDEVEARIARNVQAKLKKINKATKRSKENEINQKKTKKTKKQHDELKNLKDLSFKQEAKHPTIDEELIETDEIGKEGAAAPIIAAITTNEAVVADSTNTQANIDPTNFPTVILKQPQFNEITSTVIDADMEEMDDVNTLHHMTISEAFEDDDIVADFGQEKSKDSELKNTEIELSMPGWGSWAGAGIDETTERKPNKRFVLKLATEEKRRDQNRDTVYINEEPAKQLRPHLVSDLPFPFTTLQDYEASIRAPIGRNFVPETAFRLLTRPAVITRKGTIIEPMDETELSKKPQRPRNVVERRISAVAKANVAAAK